MTALPPTVVLAGWSGSGKTTLLLGLVAEFRARGYRVATLKHAHHSFEIDHEGKDSFEHRRAGSEQVLVSSARRWALIRELGEAEEELSLAALLRRLEPCDLVLAEGFKRSAVPGVAKLEVHRPVLGKPLLATADSGIFAVATDDPALEAPCPVLPLSMTSAVADGILERLGLKGIESSQGS